MAEEKGDPPSAKSISGEGYNQTYVILAFPEDPDAKNADTHEVLFRCGNWCYKGLVQFTGLKVSTTDLPILIPTLQKQQGSLRYCCNAKSIPTSSVYHDPISFLYAATDFIGEEMISDHIQSELQKMSSVFPWINDDTATTYFELTLGNMPDYMDKIGLIASKTYTRGLIIIAIYFENTLYFVIQPGDGDQALLDVRFPDVSKHGQGLLLQCYNDDSVAYRKLTLWHSVEPEVVIEPKIIPKIKTMSVSSTNYQQTYCIMQSTWDRASPTLSVHHDVLFRFGSWCYAGRVQLTPALSLSDIPFVIPALRMQQSRLDYVFDTGHIPTTSPFAPCLDFSHRLAPLIEAHIAGSEEALQSLIDRLSKMGLGESISRWLEGDPASSFFEFKLQPDSDMLRALSGIELVASKCYHPSGIVTVTIIFQNMVYVSLQDGSKENPLLDSRFPDVSGKGRGYQIQAFPDGSAEWPTLRKVSIWQTVAALEQEFRDRAAQVAQSKLKDETALEASLKGDEGTPGEGPAGTGLKQIEGGGEGVLGGSGFVDSASRFTSSGRAPEDIAEPKSGIVSVNGQPSSSAVRCNGVDPSTPTKAQTDDGTSTTTGEDTKEASNASASSRGMPARSMVAVARPHHLPKLDSLSKRLDEIRLTMAAEQDGDAPWDSKGKPLGKLNLAKK